MTQLVPESTERTPDSTALMGLAPLLRMAYAGENLAPLSAQLIARATHDAGDANALMDLSTLLLLAFNRDLALATQAQALAIRQRYTLPASVQPPAVRLLVLAAPGDLMANTPIECLLEHSDISVDKLYLDPDAPLPALSDDHDALFVAVCESDRNRPLLQALSHRLENWPRPVINRPERILDLSRDGASALLGDLPGVAMPATARLDRQALADLGRGALPLATVLDDAEFPIIARPCGSHAGQGLTRLDAPQAIDAYLLERPEPGFYIAKFVDYRSADGQFRKYRVALIGGRPYLCHMAVSSHWMIHYLNAGMTDSAAKRDEEAVAMQQFDAGFAARHQAALAAVHARMGLDYLGIDCAETAAGELLIFEVDNGMVVHAMDPVDLFPYKQPQMRKVFAAFRDLLTAAAQRDPGQDAAAGR